MRLVAVAIDGGGDGMCGGGAEEVVNKLVAIKIMKNNNKHNNKTNCD